MGPRLNQIMTSANNPFRCYLSRTFAPAPVSVGVHVDHVHRSLPVLLPDQSWPLLEVRATLFSLDIDRKAGELISRQSSLTRSITSGRSAAKYLHRAALPNKAIQRLVDVLLGVLMVIHTRRNNTLGHLQPEVLYD